MVNEDKKARNENCAEEVDTDLRALCQGLTVSHVANAKALILESKLVAAKIISEDQLLTPDLVATPATIAETQFNEALDLVEEVELKLQDSTSDETANLMMLAAVTKHMVESGSADIFDSTTAAQELTNTAKLLAEISRSKRQFKATFKDDLGEKLRAVKTDLTSTLKEAYDTTLVETFSVIDVDTATSVLDKDFSVPSIFIANQMYPVSTSGSIALTFVASGGTEKMMDVTKTIVDSLHTITFFDGADNSIVFSRGDNLGKLKLVSIGAAQVNTEIGDLKLGTTDLGGGVSLTISKPTTSVSGSSVLTAGRFHKLEITAGGQNFVLVLGNIKSANGAILPLGIVGIKGLFDTDTMYTLKSANINGSKFPFEVGSIAEALNEARSESIEGLKAAHSIAESLLNSSNVTTKRQANLVYSVTNLAMHLNESTNREKALSKLLDKLNVAKAGRNIFNFVAKVQKGQADELVLNDFKGISDIQNYFAGAGTDTMLAALDRSLSALNVLESTIGSDVKLTDELMSLEWNGVTTKFERKDLYFLKSAFNLLKFVMHFVSFNNFDISDAAVKTILESKEQTDPATSFELALEHYSQVGYTAPEIGLLEVLKADSAFLGARSFAHGSGAKAALVAALDQMLQFIESAEGLVTSGAFYVKSEDMAEVKRDKKVLLSIYNNLAGAYHPTVGIEGKKGAEWYSLEASEGETLSYRYDSSIRNTGPFDLSYVYTTESVPHCNWDMNSMQCQWTYYTQESYTRFALGSLFNRSLRQIIEGGSVKAATATTIDQLLESHLTNGVLSATVRAFVPGAEFVDLVQNQEVIPQQVVVMHMPEVTAIPLTFSLTDPSLTFSVNEVTDGVMFMQTTTSVTTTDPTSFRVYIKSYPDESVKSALLDDGGQLNTTVKYYRGVYLELHYSADGKFALGENDRFFSCSDLMTQTGQSLEFINVNDCQENPHYGLPTDPLIGARFADRK